MADFTFLFNRKGALYPLDFASSAPPIRLAPAAAAATNDDAARNTGPTVTTPAVSQSDKPTPTPKTAQNSSEWPFNSMQDSTLVHLCAKVIVSLPTAEIERITDLIPAELFTALFKASLYPVKDNAIDVLINKWPFKSLIISKYVSNMFSSIVTLYSDAEMAQRTRLGVKYSADIVHSFIDALRNRHTKLRFLDITSLPLAEIIVKYVATHCRLAQKEHQRNCLIDEYLQNVSDLENLYDKTTALSNSLSNIATTINNATDELAATTGTEPLKHVLVPVAPAALPPAVVPPHVRNDLKKTTSLPDEPLILKFDCILQERATYDELMGALEANSVTNRFCLQVAKLDLLCLGKTNIIKLLDRLDKNQIEGLRLQYNSITEESIRDIIPFMGQLRNLRALDLSCNLIDYRQNADTTRQLSEALGSLEHLHRIDLSGSPIGGCLSTLIQYIRQPLKYLSLHSCGLLDMDLFYLAGSKHTLVEHLDLSDNRLTRFSDALIVLLKRCAQSLYVLELDDNRFDCIDYLTIICVARKMPRLRVLATKGTFETNDHLLGAEFLQHSTSLLAWRISYPIDVYDPNQSDMVVQEANKRVLVNRLLQIVKDRFKLVVNELFF